MAEHHTVVILVMGMRQISLLLPFSNVLVSPHACVWGDHIHLNPVVSLLVFVGAEAPTETILSLLREAWPWLLDALCSGKLDLQLLSFTEPLMLCRTLVRAAPTRLPSAFYFCKCSPREKDQWLHALRWSTGKRTHIQSRFIFNKMCWDARCYH